MFYVTIANNSYIRIAGTGEFEKKIGTKIPTNSVFEYAMVHKKTVVIKNPVENPICLDCENVFECKEQYMLKSIQESYPGFVVVQ